MAFSIDSLSLPYFKQKHLQEPAPSGSLDYHEEIARIVLKILCSEQRSLSLKEIHDELCKFTVNGLADGHFIYTLDMTQLSEILNDFPDHFVLTRLARHQVEVKAKTKIEFCKIHCTKSGHCPGRPMVPCNGLHICKYYIFDNCTFDNNCKYGHDLKTQHNLQIRNNYLLDQLKEQELKYLLNLAESRSEIMIPKICKFYNVEGGCVNQKHRKACPHLHICRHYIMDRCTFGRHCKRNHNINSPDVKELLTRYKINIGRPPKEIIAELRDALSRDEVDTYHHGTQINSRLTSKWAISTPNLAMQNRCFRIESDSSDSHSDDSSSNSITGATGATRRKSPRSMSTTNLTMQNQSLRPLLVYYDSDSDKSDSNDDEGPSGGAKRKSRVMCTRDLFKQKSSLHSLLDPSYNNSNDRSSRVRDGARRKHSASKSHLSGSKMNTTPYRHLSAKSTQERFICLYHLRGRCQFGRSCRNEHKNMPYQWQLKYQADDEWEDLDQRNNEDVELEFSKPYRDDWSYENRYGQRVHIFFEKMEGKTNDRRKLKIRRLSTVSFVTGSQLFTTRWLWFWQDGGDWVEYGSKMTGCKSSIGSDAIEQKYLENPEGQWQLATQGFEWILNFKDMLQQNLSTKSTCKVKRRPEYQTSTQIHKCITPTIV